MGYVLSVHPTAWELSSAYSCTCRPLWRKPFFFRFSSHRVKILIYTLQSKQQLKPFDPAFFLGLSKLQYVLVEPFAQAF